MLASFEHDRENIDAMIAQPKRVAQANAPTH
jgi:hypothetical protein